MNLPNIGYFNYRPTYAGSPINETEKYYKAISDEYTVNRDSYDALQLAMSQTNAVSDSEKKYVDTIKNSINENLKKVAKDTQGNIRFEQANQVVRNMAIKYATDETLSQIKDNYKLYQDAEKIKRELAAKGQRPIGFETDNFEGLTFDDKGKPIVKKYNGWYEPHGAWDDGYNSLYDNLGYDSRNQLRLLDSKIKSGTATPDEQKQYDKYFNDLFEQSKSVAETEQDIAQLKQRFNGDESKVKDFIINNRLKPRVNYKPKLEQQYDLAVAKEKERLQNQIELENVKQDNRVELQDVKQEGKVELQKLKDIAKLGSKNNTGQNLFSEHNSPNEVSDNPYQSQKIKLDFDNKGTTITKPKSSIGETSANIAQGMSPTFFNSNSVNISTIKEKEANVQLKKLEDFRKANPKFKDYSDRTLAEVYNKAISEEDRIVGRTHRMNLPENQKEQFNTYFKEVALTNPQTVIQGRDEKDRKPLIEKLKDTGKDFEFDDLKNIQFIGLRTLGNAKSADEANGALVYTIRNKKGEAETILVPAPREVSSKFKVFNEAHKAALKTSLEDEGKGLTHKVSATEMFGIPNLWLEPHRKFNEKTGRIDTTFTLSISEDEKGNKRVIPSGKRLEQLSELIGLQLDNNYTLEDLQNISLLQASNTPFIKLPLNLPKTVEEKFGN